MSRGVTEAAVLPPLPTLCPPAGGSLLSPPLSRRPLWCCSWSWCRAVTAGKGGWPCAAPVSGRRAHRAQVAPAGGLRAPLPGAAPALNRRLPQSPSGRPCCLPLPFVTQPSAVSAAAVLPDPAPLSTHHRCPPAADARPGPAMGRQRPVCGALPLSMVLTPRPCPVCPPRRRGWRPSAPSLAPPSPPPA